MEKEVFKKTFDNLSQKYGFERAFNGWFKSSQECIVVLDLMKSNYGNYYELNIKTFIQGVFGKHYSKSRDLVHKEVGNILKRPPNEYRSILDLDFLMTDEERIHKLDLLFIEFIIPLTDNLLTRSGIKELVQNQKLKLLPPVQEELNR